MRRSDAAVRGPARVLSAASTGREAEKGMGRLRLLRMLMETLNGVRAVVAAGRAMERETGERSHTSVRGRGMRNEDTRSKAERGEEEAGAAGSAVGPPSLLRRSDVKDPARTSLRCE
jgi:hypothetical protein